jgi:hypothetical protein
MLWPRAMRIPRVFPAALLFSAPLLGACGSLDEEPPPAVPQNGDALPPPPAPIDPATATATPADGNGMYASEEYALGEDPDSYEDNDPSALTDFRQTLAPYGAWSDDPTYGTTWTPSPGVVGPDFTPYVTAGHWVYDDDYTWVSDYDWGWAPYHYGRWVFIDGRGWSWIPGRVYRGAWVGWGVDDGYGYVGWYPLAPPFFWFGGVAVGYGFAIGPRWTYCPHGAIFSPGLGGRVVAGPSVNAVAARVHPVGGAAEGLGRGPEPSRLGFAASQVPHASGTSAAGLARAQQFSRPSTATALGGHAATHASSMSSASAFGRGSLTGAGAHPALPATQPGAGKRKPSVGTTAPHVGGSFRGGGFRGGGFHGGGGGGGHGGGGHR